MSYDWDDPYAPLPRTVHPGLGLTSDYVRGHEAGMDLPESWMRYHPPCSEGDPEVFFPKKGDYSAVRMAKRICDSCPMETDCLDHHLGERSGVWGGTTEPERRVLRKRLDGTWAAAGVA